MTSLWSKKKREFQETALIEVVEIIYSLPIRKNRQDTVYNVREELR
jgi:hypothetical protein